MGTGITPVLWAPNCNKIRHFDAIDVHEDAKILNDVGVQTPVAS